MRSLFFSLPFVVAACGNASGEADVNGTDAAVAHDALLASDVAPIRDSALPKDVSVSTDAPIHIDDGSADAETAATQDAGGPQGEFYVITLPNETRAAAIFSATPFTSGCPIITDGDCIFYDCAQGQSIAYTNTSASPGTISVTSGANALQLFLTQNVFFASVTGTPPFAAGSTVTVQATGNVVPTFTEVMTMPTTPTLSAPSANAVASRQSPLVFNWTGGADTNVIAVAIQIGLKSLQCELPAAGVTTGSIPVTLLSKFPAAGGSLTVTAYNVDRRMVGIYNVEFIAGTQMALNGITLQ